MRRALLFAVAVGALWVAVYALGESNQRTFGFYLQWATGPRTVATVMGAFAGGVFAAAILSPGGPFGEWLPARIVRVWWRKMTAWAERAERQ